MKSQWITYKDKKILFADYSDFTDDSQSLFSEVNDVNEIIMQQPEGSLLLLMDTRNSIASIEVISYFKQTALKTKKYIARIAVIGITGVRKILFDTIVQFSGLNAAIFENLEEGKEWLAE